MGLPGAEQRAAVRLPLAEPLPAMLGDASARIIEVSLIGCRLEHDARMPVGTMTSLDVSWRGQNTRLTVAIARSELRIVNGRGLYLSGVQFCSTIFDSPEPIPSIIASEVQEVGPLTPRPASAATVAETAPYIECSLDETSWTKRPVWTPRQPREGFTMPAPESSKELDRFCRAYLRADADVRRQLRAAAELAIVREGKHALGSSN